MARNVRRAGRTVIASLVFWVTAAVGGDVASASAPAPSTTAVAVVGSAIPVSSPRPRQTEAERRAAQQATRITAQARRREHRAADAAARRAHARAASAAAREARQASPRKPASTATSAAKVGIEVAGVTITLPSPVVPAPPNPSGARRTPRGEELQDLLTRWTATRPDLNAMSVTIRHNGQSWTGSAQNGGASPDPGQRYRSLSVTKTITAALVLRQVELGTLSLDQPLPPLLGLSTLPPPGLTVGHLLRHRSGLVDYNAAPGYLPNAPLSPRDAVELTLRAPLRTPVDSATAYTNSNYLYLGLLLEQVTGRSYGDLVSEIAASIGMSSTGLEPPDRTGWPGFSSGGVMSTTADLALWGEALTTPGRILREPSLREMERFDENRAGLGLWAYCPCPSPYGLRIVGHHTASGGMFIETNSGLVIVMRADVETGDTAGRARSLIGAIIALSTTS